MARTPNPPSPLRSLWNLAWRAPWKFFGQFYAIVLVFSYTIGFAIWPTGFLAGVEPQDDITLMVLRVREVAS